jgi:hypothetical protein
MKKRKINKNFIRLVAILILTIFLATSANSALVKNNFIFSKLNAPPIEPLRDDYYEWRDDFGNEQKIDITKSWGYVVEGGVAKMKNTYPIWTDPSWEKLRPINVGNSGGTLNNFALNFIVEYDSDMQDDYDDIRFKHENTPTNFLDYWIESYDSSEASIWVKIPELPSGSSKMYLFYGNPDATSESDFGDVFDDWDEKWANDKMISECDPEVEGVWDPDIGYGNNEFLVCWEEAWPYGYPSWPPHLGCEQEIRASIYTPDGTASVHDKRVFSDADDGWDYFRNDDPSVAYGSSGKFGVVWEHWDPSNEVPYNPNDGWPSKNIYGRTVKKSGTSLSLGSVEMICDASNIQADPCIVYDSENSHYVVVWEDARYGTAEYDIYGAICDSNLNVISEEVICDDTLSQAEPWIAYDNVNSQFMIVWEEGVNPEDGPWKIMGGIFDDELNEISSFTVAEDDDYPGDIDYNFPCVEFDEDSERYLVTWNDGDISDNDWWGDIWGKIYSSSGSVKVDQFLIKGGEYVRTEIVNYLTDSFFVSYDNDYKVYGRLISSEGDTLGSDFKLSAGPAAAADWASMATDGSKIFVAWEDERLEKPDFLPDAFGNIWNLNIPDSSDITITWGQEKEMILEAQVTSKEIQPTNLVKWHMFEVDYTGTITFDILDATGDNILIENANSGEDLSAIDPEQHPILRLRAHFTRDDPSYTPTLNWWRILYEGLDEEPPITKVDYVDGVQGLSPWYISECVTIWLKAMDYPEDTGSGIKFTYYTIDGGSTQIYDPVSGIHVCSYEPDWFGDWEVNFWSEDNQGNIEDKNKQQNFRTIYIDAKKPEVWITSPTEEAEVAVPFWVYADATDNAGVERVDFDIEPFGQRQGLPWSDYNAPYEWLCEEEPIARPKAQIPYLNGVMVQVRASAYDESGQYWIHEVFIQVTNWEGTISSFLIYNYKPLIDAIKLGIAVDSKLRLSMSNLKNADSVRFTATNAITGSHKNSWDNDFSDGISADLAIPTGFYKITATPYSYGNEMTTTLVGWLIFIRS